jgi:hypothetical protein
LGFSTKDILSFSVIGALVTTVGALVAMVLKERFFARSFEEWKSSQALNAVHQKYRDPIVLSAL